MRVGGCLSLSGKFAAFGRQAALGLEAWQEWDGGIELVLEDDRSDVRELERVLPETLASCDVTLGPYSTKLMRRAGQIAADHGKLLWNHGGAGDDVQAAHPGYCLSVLTKASRYALPFIEYLSSTGAAGPIWIVEGKGSFGRQVAHGARSAARQSDMHLAQPKKGPWNLFSAGAFEEDIAVIRQAMTEPNPPKLACAVAAGVHRFAQEVKNPEGIFGVGQWSPGVIKKPELGPKEDDFLRAFKQRAGEPADYPAVQALAAAVIGVHCVEQAGTTSRAAVWEAATTLDTDTLFGRFKVEPSGAQAGHQGVLVRWDREGLKRVSRQAPA